MITILLAIYVVGFFVHLIVGGYLGAEFVDVLFVSLIWPIWMPYGLSRVFG